MKFLNNIINLNQTVFTIRDIKSITNYKDESLRSFLKRAKKSNILINIRRGLRALPNYDKFELACKLRNKSYISLETVLYQQGLIFQYYENTITCISDNTRSYTLQGIEYRYSKIKDELLNNYIGVRSYKNYDIATPERALCDMIYILPSATIENPEGLNKVRLQQILKFYPKKTNLYINKIVDGI